MTLDLAALVELLLTTIERDRFPLSPLVKRLRGILAKLDPLPPPKPLEERSAKLLRSGGGR